MMKVQKLERKRIIILELLKKNILKKNWKLQYSKKKRTLLEILKESISNQIMKVQ